MAPASSRPMKSPPSTYLCVCFFEPHTFVLQLTVLCVLSGGLTIIIVRYDVSHHPEVMSGKKTAADAYKVRGCLWCWPLYNPTPI